MKRKISKPMRAGLLAASMTVFVLTGCGGADSQSAPSEQPPPPAHVAIVRDRSESQGDSCGCDAVVALARRTLYMPQLGAGSTLTITVTGDDASAGEPMPLGEYEIPNTRRVLDGRSKINDRREEILDEIRTRCEQKPPTRRTPVYLAMRRAADDLRAAGCDGRTPCFLFVQSDLEERSEQRIRQALEQEPRPNRRVSLTQNAPKPSAQMPTRINNAGVLVTFYGVAATSGTATGSDGKQNTRTQLRDADHVDRLEQVWRSMFTDPQNLLFRSQCVED